MNYIYNAMSYFYNTQPITNRQEEQDDSFVILEKTSSFEQNSDTIKTFPDRYRPICFNLKHDIDYISETFYLKNNNPDYIELAQLTNTRTKYWLMTKADITNKLIAYVGDYSGLPNHKLTDYLISISKYPELDWYYQKVYDIADIIIAQSIINNNRTWIHDCCLRLVAINNNHANNHINLRMIFYLACYMIKLYKESHGEFKTVLQNKLIEFEKNDAITKYITKDELANYQIFLSNIAC